MFLESRAPVAGALMSGLLAGVVLAQSPAGAPRDAAIQSNQGAAAGVRVSGRLVPPERLHLTGGSLVLSPLGDTPRGELSGVTLLPDGAFVLGGLMTGSHLLQVDGLPERWVLKSVVFRGEDVTDAGIETSPGQRVADVSITVTDAATEVSGVVTDADGQRVSDAVVLIIPLSEQFWRPSSRRLAVLHSDGEGRFLIRGLPEGEYRAAACRPSKEEDPSRPEVLRRFSESGVEVSLRGIGHRVVNLTLTPPTAGGASVR